MTDELVQLPTKFKPPNPHIFGMPKGVEPNATLGRDQQTERQCPRCKLVKITVHPPQGDGYRLYRWGDAPTQFYDPVMPECSAVSSEPAA